MALVIKDKPVTFERVRRGLIHRLGAVPRGEVAATYVEPAIAGSLDEIEMLRLHLDVAQSDGRARDGRITALERRADAHDAILDEYLGAVQTMCTYLADAASRLRANL